MTEDDLSVMAAHHAREGRQHLANQRRIIARLIRLGADTRLAEDVLDAMMVAQDHHLAACEAGSIRRLLARTSAQNAAICRQIVSADHALAASRTLLAPPERQHPLRPVWKAG
jgi:hypothetical protein